MEIDHGEVMNVACDATLCAHFGECGGCESQDIAYEEQLTRKELALRELFARHWSGAIPVEPSPRVWHYRNKLDPNFGRKQYPTPPPKGFPRELVLGFKRKGRWFWNIDVETCLIGPPDISSLMESVRAWAKAQGLPVFNSRTHEGFFRALLIREGARTGQRMVVLITCEGDFDKVGFVEAVRTSCPCTSIQRGIHRGWAETALAQELELLEGAPYIIEELRVPDGANARALRFQISPFSFFQTNTLAAERLYGQIRTWVAERAPEVLYDFYGGSGGIALSCADLANEVVSVESVADAGADGRQNASMNGIQNVTFITQPVEDYLRDVAAQDGAGLAERSVVVLDPPRNGLHPKALRRLLRLAPRHIIYVACKPEVLAQQELAAFDDAYTLCELRAVDLFPHTRHVEVLARLERKG